MTTQTPYDKFIRNKIRMAQSTGFKIDINQINPALKHHNKLMVKWMVEGGRRACFAAFGLHKTVTQLEAVRCTLLNTGGRGLIICPLGVRQEFKRDAIKILNWPVAPKFIRSIDEADETGIYLTNYETVRDGKLDPRLFNAVSLDEASILRGFGGSKTFREFMRLFTGDVGPAAGMRFKDKTGLAANGLSRRGTLCVPYRFVATATPSPNDYIELLAYADFLGVMDVSQAKTRFFKRDSTKADKLTLHPHKEEEFWLWVASWALFVTKPSDLTGNTDDDKDYIMPELDLRWHELPSDHSTAGVMRKIGVERIEISGKKFMLVNNDAVLESKNLKENSIGLILTSIPFSTQYEYSPNYSDFGHSENNEEFFQQMDYLTPELFRSLIPGRVAAIHVKDRIIPGGLTGLGFQTVYPFHKHCIDHYTKHGFGYMGMKTIVTDVVRENNQTYRLGWTEQCKDGSKMGVGMPEYLLYFRKPQTDTTKSYSDDPVIKSKGTYSRSRWQTDAHGFTRSSGNRILDPEELKSLDHDVIFKLFKDHTLNNVYDFEHHVKIGEELDKIGKLPSTFMLLQPQSWSDEVWTDVTRMLTLNSAQSSKGKEMHLCPMQFDIADRVITQLSNEGDIVLDPFGGLMTVPYRAVLLKRFGIAFELNHSYFIDGAHYCKAAEVKQNMPSLFDTLKESA